MADDDTQNSPAQAADESGTTLASNTGQPSLPSGIRTQGGGGALTSDDEDTSVV